MRTTSLSDPARRRALLQLAGCTLLAMPVMAASFPSVAALSGDGLFDAFRALPKALWVWRTSLDQWPKLARFCVDYGFDTVFLSIPPAERRELDRASLAPLANLADNGTALHLTGGDVRWLKEAGGLPEPLIGLVDLQRRWSLFQGLHLDIEPQTTADWKEPSARAHQEAAFGDLLARLRDRFPAVDDRRLTLASHPSFAPGLLDRLSPYVDGIAVMAYRNRTEQTLRLMGPSLQWAGAEGKAVWAGMTTQNGPEAERISYFGLGAERLIKDALILSRDLETLQPGTRLAFQHYQTLKVLL